MYHTSSTTTETEASAALATLLAPLAKMLAQEVANIMLAQQTEAPKAPAMGKRFYSVTELGQEFGLSDSLVYAMIRKGQVKFYQFGDRRMVLDINEVMAACQKKNPTLSEKEAFAVAAARRRPGRPTGRKVREILV